MKNKKVVLLLCLLLICCIFAIVGCEKAHSHTFAGEWSKDETHHWHSATCGHDEVKDKAEHTWDGGVAQPDATCETSGVKTYTCTVCKATKTETLSAKNHTFADVWSSDEQYHWYAATCGHDVVDSKAKHVFEEGESCNICQYDSSLGLNYDEKDGAYIVTGLKEGSDKSQIVVPQYYKGVEVRGIGEKAFAYIDSIVSVVISQGVTEIGIDAFLGCESLTSVEIPDSVTKIGGQAFGKCSKLRSIVIPGSVESIAYCAFEDCIQLERIELSEGLQSIGIDVFAGCKQLKSIEIPASVEFLTSMFGRSGVESIIISADNASYESKGNCIIDKKWDMVVAGCNTSVIPEGVKEIKANAFRDIADIKSVKIPTGVTQIGNMAFKDCTALTRVEIPITVDTIGISAFDGCTSAEFYCEVGSQPAGWSNDWAPSDSVVEWGYQNYEGDEFDYIISTNGKVFITNYKGADTDVVIPQNVDGREVVALYASFSGTGITSIEIPSGVTEIVDRAFKSCKNLESVSFAENSKLTSIGSGAFDSCIKLTSINIPNGVKSIGSSAFNGCSALADISIPQGVVEIGDSAFDSCAALSRINIPQSVTKIGDYAFRRCTRLSQMTVDVGNAAYRSENNCIISLATNELIFGCKNTVIPSSISIIGKYAFYGCTGLTGLEIPSNVVAIGESAFDGCTGLNTNIIIPDSVTKIGKGLFANCTNITSITFPKNATEIYQDMFKGCTALTSVTLPDTIEKIGKQAFYKCENLINITIPDSVTYIDGSAFERCASLTSVRIPDSVTFIGSSAFSYCSKLQSVNIPVGMSVISTHTFSYCSELESIDIPRNITAIGKSAFMSCSNLQRVTIPSSVVTMEASVFGFCSKSNIKIEASSKPDGWADNWTGSLSSKNIEWGVIL